MTVFDPADLEYPLRVTITRPAGTFDEAGEYTEHFDTVASDLPADIQLSLQVRTLTSRDETGASDNTVWMMYCNPPAPIRRGDRISDGDRAFVVDAAGDWGSHTECMLREV